MRCLVVRHAPAEEGSPDQARALTPQAIRRMRRAGRVLAARVPLAVIAASPLRRAQQTAAAIAAAAGMPMEALAALAPGRWPELWPWLAQRQDDICLVGHAPDLDAFMCAALAETGPTFISLRKGGAALLEFSGVPRAGHAELRWLLTPSLLRNLRAR
jgi:phosphohistidine phosphatase